MNKLNLALLLAVALTPASAAAQPTAPQTSAPAPSSVVTAGPVFTSFGRVAPVDTDVAIPPNMALRHSFDVAAPAKNGPNSGFDSVARFINMHAASGMPRSAVRAALVVHGPAALELTREAFYKERNKGAANPSAALVSALVAEGVDIYLCGQTAASLGITRADLLPGVKMALSAMTAHALLQQQGYSINPF